MGKRKLILLLLLSLLIILSFFAVKSYLNSSVLTLKVKNVKEISLYSSDDKTKIVKTFKGSGSYRVADGAYLIKYTGQDGFADGDEEFTLNNSDKTMVIAPEYSTAKLSKILDSEIEKIHNELNNQIRGISQYQIQRGALYKYGEWYGTTLVYNGNDEYSADMLRVLMKKEGETWKVMTKTPSIHVTRGLATGAPDDVIERLNDLPTIIQKRFTGSQ